MHGAKHGWERLEWICSLARLVERSPDLDWDYLIETAYYYGALRGMYLALLLANDVCAVPLPQNIAELAIADKGARELADQLKARLFEQPTSHRAREFQRHAFYLRSRERLVDRVRISGFPALASHTPWPRIGISSACRPECRSCTTFSGL